MKQIIGVLVTRPSVTHYFQGRCYIGFMIETVREYQCHGGLEANLIDVECSYSFDDPAVLWKLSVGARLKLTGKLGFKYFDDMYNGLSVMETIDIADLQIVDEAGNMEPIRQMEDNTLSKHQDWQSGFRPGDLIKDEYKGHLIIEANEVIQVVDPSNGTRFIVDLDDSKEGGNRRSLEKSIEEQLVMAREYIDFKTNLKK